MSVGSMSQWRKEHILGYVPKNDEKYLVHKGLNWLGKL